MLNHVDSIISKLQITIGKIAIVAVFLTLLLTMPVMSANAATVQPIASIGAKHQAEGAIKQGVGKVEQITGDVKGKAEGLTRQVDGKAKRDIGRVESKAEEFANRSGRKANDLGEQIQDAAGSFADSVKDLVK